MDWRPDAASGYRNSLVDSALSGNHGRLPAVGVAGGRKVGVDPEARGVESGGDGRLPGWLGQRARIELEPRFGEPVVGADPVFSSGIDDPAWARGRIGTGPIMTSRAVVPRSASRDSTSRRASTEALWSSAT